MPCCHADFALTESSDRAFTVGMPTFTFGAGCLAEAGEHAPRARTQARRALHRSHDLRELAYVATVRGARSRPQSIDAVIYDEVVVEPTTASFQAAARFAADGRFDGYVSVGGGSVMDTCKAANLYATHPAEFMTYVNAPIGGGQKVPGPVQAAHRLSDDVGHRLGDDRHRDLQPDRDQREDRHHLAAPDSDASR